MNHKPTKPVDYADLQIESARPHSGRKDTIELFREPPAIAKANLSDVIIWVASFLVGLAALLWMVRRWLS